MKHTYFSLSLTGAAPRFSQVSIWIGLVADTDEAAGIQLYKAEWSRMYASVSLTSCFQSHTPTIEEL